MTDKITVSLPAPLILTLDGLAARWKTTRSGAVAELIRQAEKAKFESELAEGYAEYAAQNRRDAEFFLPAQAEVLPNDSD
ncbi:MAG TPA: CopG family transcriptional regulator [Spirochaetia bacterium]|nr:CopG family transcriptional regulator [Spirochaetia bacterium]